MELTDRAREKLTSVIDWLQTEEAKDEFDMLVFTQTVACGTACCIAGKIYLDNEAEIENDFCQDSTWIQPENVGYWLGLDEDVQNALFYGWNGSIDGTDQWVNLQTITPKMAAETIRLFLETGEVKWTPSSS